MKKISFILALIVFSALMVPSSNAWDDWNTKVLTIKGLCLHQSALYQASGGIGGEELADQMDYAYPIAGESYRADNSMSLLKKYGKDEKFESSITGLLEDDPYKVFITKATLVPEPSNKFDKFAVKVLIKGKHVGYVPSLVSYDVSLMMHKTKKKSLIVNSCISHYPGGQGPQVSLDLTTSFLGDDYEAEYRMGLWFGYNDWVEYGPGTKCTKYFSKWYCGPLEK
jgi:hypothetical protein